MAGRAQHPGTAPRTRTAACRHQPEHSRAEREVRVAGDSGLNTSQHNALSTSDANHLSKKKCGQQIKENHYPPLLGSGGPVSGLEALGQVVRSWRGPSHATSRQFHHPLGLARRCCARTEPCKQKQQHSKGMEARLQMWKAGGVWGGGEKTRKNKTPKNKECTIANDVSISTSNQQLCDMHGAHGLCTQLRSWHTRGESRQQAAWQTAWTTTSSGTRASPLLPAAPCSHLERRGVCHCTPDCQLQRETGRSSRV